MGTHHPGASLPTSFLIAEILSTMRLMRASVFSGVVRSSLPGVVSFLKSSPRGPGVGKAEVITRSSPRETANGVKAPVTEQRETPESDCFSAFSCSLGDGEVGITRHKVAPVGERWVPVRFPRYPPTRVHAPGTVSYSNPPRAELSLRPHPRPSSVSSGSPQSRQRHRRKLSLPEV